MSFHQSYRPFMLLTMFLAMHILLASFIVRPTASPTQAKMDIPLVSVPLKRFVATNFSFILDAVGTDQKIPVVKTTFDLTINPATIPPRLRSLFPALRGSNPIILRGLHANLTSITAENAAFQHLVTTTSGPLGLTSSAASLQLYNAVFQFPVLPEQAAAFAKLKSLLKPDANP